ncbi:AraC-like DNA-binding protein [Rhodococcus sp. 27YEA15]|uniref:helix-turn-helix domain-containing protein n=1 Tax=Rhodococcus sp. 27YEA15 TaxID=3156259 RepID=UPI003C7E6B3C
MTATDAFSTDGSRDGATSLEQNGHRYAEIPFAGPRASFRALWRSTTSASRLQVPKRILPDLSADFIADSTGRSWLVGPATTADLVSFDPGTTVWGLRISPPALRALLGTDADAVQDRKVAFDDVLTSRQSRILADALREGFVDDTLLRALWPHPRHDDTTERGFAALTGSPNSPVRTISADLGVSERQFRRTISVTIGLSPKMIQKVQRMQNVLSSSRAHSSPLAELATAAGYADQSHLARDVRALAGITTTQLLREHR